MIGIEVTMLVRVSLQLLDDDVEFYAATRSMPCIIKRYVSEWLM